MTAAMKRTAILIAVALVVIGTTWQLLRATSARTPGAPTAARRAAGQAPPGTRPLRVTALDAPPPSGVAPPERPQPLEWTRQLRDAMCECRDAACVREVDDRFASQIGAVAITTEDTELVSGSLQESSRCAQRILDAAAAATTDREPPRAVAQTSSTRSALPAIP